MYTVPFKRLKGKVV